MKKKFRLIITCLIVISLLLLLIGIMGCRSENNEQGETSYLANYIVKDLPLLQDFQVISSAAVKDSIVYFSILKYADNNQTNYSSDTDITGEIRYIDFSTEPIAPVTIPYAVKNNSSIIKISPNDNNTLDLLVQEFSQIGGSEISETWIKKISLNGEELASYSIIEDVNDQELIQFSGFTTDNVGNAYCIFSNVLYVWDLTGNLFCNIQIPGTSPHICLGQNGGVYVMWKEIEGFQLAIIETKTGTLKSTHTLDTSRTYLTMATGINSELLLVGDDGIYEYNVDQEEKKIISFSQSSITIGFGGELLPLSDGRMVWCYNNSFTIIQSSEKEKQSEKKTLLLGGTDDSFTMWHRNAVAKFNQSHSNFCIEIKTYGTEGDDGVRELNMEIISGKGPDIIILPRQFSMDLYTSRGVLTDLYPYMDSDETMQRTDFQENILRAYEAEGKLYGIPVYYWIRTMVVSKSSTGKIHHWNLDEMISYADNYMPASTVFSEANKSYVLNLCLMANGDSIIDWKGQRFDRNLFIKILLFANRFISDDRYTNDEKLIEQIKDTGKIQILCHQSIGSFSDPQIYLEAFGEPVSYPGFPSEKGNGNLIDSNFVIAIGSNCTDKDSAWEFINSLLSETFQISPASEVGFPIHKNALKQKIEKEMKKNYVIAEDGIKIQKEKETRFFGTDEIKIYSARGHDVQDILEVINSADKIRVWNAQISDIIYEEAGAFFDGSKTVEEVTDIVENRIQIYMKEIE